MAQAERAVTDEPAVEELQDLLGNVWLYIDWRYVTKQLTTRQKDLFADAVDGWSARLDSEMTPKHGPVADRWWAGEDVS